MGTQPECQIKQAVTTNEPTRFLKRLKMYVLTADCTAHGVWAKVPMHQHRRWAIKAWIVQNCL
jgi:hypothetical protein